MPSPISIYVLTNIIWRGLLTLKGTILAKAVKIIHCSLPIWLAHVDDALDMPSNICDSLRAIKFLSMVFFCVKTSVTHNQKAVLLIKCLFVYVCIHKQLT